MMEELPFGLILFASTMVSFVLLRKAGKGHLLMPHQRSIGMAVGWTMFTSAVAASGLYQGFSPSAPLHFPLVLLPQQAIFMASLVLRQEVSASQVVAGIVCVTALVAVSVLRSTQAVPSDLNILSGVVAASLLAATLLPGFHARVKLALLLWSSLALTPVILDSAIPPVVQMVLTEELTLLNVKLQFLETHESKQKPAKWTW